MKKLCLMFLLSYPALAATVEGVLVNQSSNGVSGATVVLMDSQTLCPVYILNTDNTGAFSAEVESGTYYISWQSPENGLLVGYYGSSNGLDLSTATPLTVDVLASGLQVQAQIGGVVSGRITGLPGGVAPQVFVVDPVSLLPASPFSSLSVVNGDGTFAVTGLATGCYLVGVSWDEMGSPLFFHPASPKASEGVMVEVQAGQSVISVDIDVDLSKLGTLNVNLGSGVEGSNPDLTAIGNHLTFSGDFQAGSSSVLLPPGNYEAAVSFDNTWRTQVLGTQTIQAGQTTEVTASPELGGVISGTIQPNSVSTLGGLQVQALDASDNVAAQQEFLAVIGATSYEISGLDPGTYRIRITANASFAPGLSSTFQIQTSQEVVITGDNQVSGVDFSLTEGGVISGRLVALGTTLFTPVTAISDEGVHYTGFALPDFQTGEVTYQITNLPPGNYKVGVHTGELSGAQLSTGFILDAMSFPLLGCNNVGPSFHSSSDTLDAATSVTVGQGATVENVDVTLKVGGGVTGQIVVEETQCPLNSGFVAVYQDGELKRLGMVADGSFEIGGLRTGSYELRLSKFFLAFEDPNNLSEIIDTGFLGFFSPSNTLAYGQSVNITSGQFQSIGEWTVALPPVTSDEPTTCPQPGADDLTLVYPWISNRTGSFESILVANNYGDEEIEVVLTATRSADEVETSCRTIPAGGFLEEAASTLFPGLGSGGGYSVLLSSPSQSVRGRWVTNSLGAPSKASPSQGVAIAIPADGQPDSRIANEVAFGYLPVTGNSISAPVLVNVGDTAADVTLRLFNSQGQEVGGETRNLEPLVPFAALANSLVPEGSGDLYMTAQSSNLITGVSFVFDSVFNEPAIGNVTAVDLEGADNGSKTLFYPWVSNRSGLFASVVTAYNYGDTPVTVTLRAARGNGQISEPVEQTIPGNGFMSRLASDLFPDLASGGGYNVTLTSPSSKVGGQWVTNNLAADSESSPSQGVAVEVSGGGDSQRVGTHLLYGYLPITGSFTSAPVIVNAGDQNTLATLRFYNHSGDLVGSTTQELAPGLPFAAIANDLVQSSQNVYLVVSSDGQPLTGVAFVFNGEFNEPAIGNATAIDFTP